MCEMNCSDLHKQWYTDSCLDESRYMVSIRLMLPHEWHLHREVRLQALLDAPLRLAALMRRKQNGAIMNGSK